jgi:hypothetical protein
MQKQVTKSDSGSPYDSNLHQITQKRGFIDPSQLKTTRKIKNPLLQDLLINFMARAIIFQVSA